MTRFSKFSFLSLLVIAGLAALAFQQLQAVTAPPPLQVAGGQQLVVSYAVHHDTSEPLAVLAQRWQASNQNSSESERPRFNLRPQLFGPDEFSFDPVVQNFDNGLLIPAPILTWDGLSNQDNFNLAGGPVVPPDITGDVGGGIYGQAVNIVLRFYTTAGAPLTPAMPGNALFAGFPGPCSTTNDGDVQLMYDEQAGRWVYSQFALPNYPAGPFSQCIAVSQTGNPAGAYHRYEFVISANLLNDYPKFGVWPDPINNGYFLSLNLFQSPAFNFVGGGAAAFERSQMLAGLPAQMIAFLPSDPDGGMLPSDLDGVPPAAGSPNVFAQFLDGAFAGGADRLKLWEFRVNWAVPAASTFINVVNLNTAPFDSNMCNFARNCIPQRGTAVRLDAISDRLMQRLQYRNFGTHRTMVTNHTVDVAVNRAGVRWYELRNAGAGWSIFQQGTYAPGTLHRWMGSAAMDVGGNIAVGYSISGPETFPSIAYAGRLDTDPLGILSQGQAALFFGAGSQTSASSRWGDYTSLTVNPQDGCTFFYTNEYYAATFAFRWRTRIGSFRFPAGTCP